MSGHEGPNGVTSVVLIYTCAAEVLNRPIGALKMPALVQVAKLLYRYRIDIYSYAVTRFAFSVLRTRSRKPCEGSFGF